MNALENISRKVLAVSASVLTFVSSCPLSSLASNGEIPEAQKTLPVNAASKRNPRKRAAEMKLLMKKSHLSRSPDDLEVRQFRGLPEPVIPIMDLKDVPGENAALAIALNQFQDRSNAEDLSSLEKFASRFPNSKWAPSIELNMGLLESQQGLMSRARQHWTSAWEKSKQTKELLSIPVADHAVSELAVLDARLGRKEELDSLLKELGPRSLRGSSETRLNEAKAGLIAQKRSPENSFKCGPFALNAILNRGKAAKNYNPVLKAAKSTSNGTNLNQVLSLSKQVGLEMQMAKREPGAKVLFPSVIHWKLNHFGAITQVHGQKYKLEDATFDDSGKSWITESVIDSESDGYFLVPAGPLPAGWRTVGAAEAENVWGRGRAQGRGPKCPGAPKNGKGKPSKPPRPNPPKRPQPPCNDRCGCSKPNPGMAEPSTWTMQAELNIQDVPFVWNTPFGDMGFVLNYNQNEADQPTFTFTNMGDWWTLDWVSWLTLDTSRNATVHVRGGGSEIYEYQLPDNVNNPYPRAPLSQANLTIADTGVYQRELPDGSIEVFGLSDGTNYFMTSVIDPQGNVVSINWDTVNFRILSISDPTGAPVTFSYVSNTVGNSGYYKLASIADILGRSASFAYDSTNTYLLSITDPIGVASKFSYVSGSSFITTLTTPYGATSFYSYVPDGGLEYPPQGLRIVYPDGTMNVTENWIGETKTTYFWDRQGMALYPNDPADHIYTHSHNTKFLYDAATQNESAIINYERDPLEGPVYYFTEGEQARDIAGTSNLPVSIFRSLTGNPNHLLALSGSIKAGDLIEIKIGDPGSTGGDETDSYTVQSTDTLSTVAQALAKAVNASPVLPALGILGQANGNSLTLSSLSADRTTMTVKVTPTATETLAFSSTGTLTNITIGGTATSNDKIKITISSGLFDSGSLIVESSTIASSDSLTDIAVKTASALSASPEFINKGFTVTSNENVVSIFAPETSTYQGEVETTAGITATMNFNGTVASIGGTVSADAPGITISDAALPGGAKTVSASTQSGDLLSSVALELASKISVDPDLKAAGISAFPVGESLVIQSQSANQTSFAKSAGSTTETITFSTTDNIVETSSYQFNALGNVTKSVDPLGRTLESSYDVNGIDLLELRETKNGDNLLLGKWFYNDQHEPVKLIDGSGLQSLVTYNIDGQPASATDNMGNQATMIYSNVTPVVFGGTAQSGKVLSLNISGTSISYTTSSTNLADYANGFSTLINAANIPGVASFVTGQTLRVRGPSDTTITNTTGIGLTTITITPGSPVNSYIESINGPMAGSQDTVRFSWNLEGTLKSITNSQGYTQDFAYDNFNRLTQANFPDGSSEKTSYLNLDPIFSIDRLGRTSSFTFDSMDQLVSETDPEGRTTTYKWCGCGSIATLTDANGQVTTWNHDLEGRVYEKIYQDNSKVQYSYFPSVSLVYKKTDALNQSKFLNFGLDNSVLGVNYENEVNATSSVSYQYDDKFPRLLSAKNGMGKITYEYNGFISDPTESALTNRVIWLQGRAGYDSTSSLTDVVNVKISNAAISGGSRTVQYLVASTDKSLLDLASHIKDLINNDSVLSAAGIQATANGGSVQVDGIAVETIGGTIQAGDTVSIKVSNKNISGGSQAFTHTVSGGDTKNAIASDLASQISTALSSLGITAVAQSANIVLHSTNASNTSFSEFTSNSALITIAFSGTVQSYSKGKWTEILTPGDAASYTVAVTINDSAISGGTQTFSSTNGSCAAIIADLSSQINTALNSIGITATTDSALRLFVSSHTLNQTTYTQTASGTVPRPGFALVQPKIEGFEGATELASLSGRFTGAGRLSTITNDFIANSQQRLEYDPQGRTVKRSINGTANEVYNFFDAADRATGTKNNLGAFTYSYVDDDPLLGSKGDSRLSSLLYPNGQVTKFGYFATTFDERLQHIQNFDSTGNSLLSQFDYDFDADGQIINWNQLQKASHINSRFEYDKAGQLVGAQGGTGGSVQPFVNQSHYVYDQAANRVSTQTSRDQLGNLSGTLTVGDVITLTVSDPALSGGSRTIAGYTVASGDTLSKVAANIAALASSDSTLQGAGISAVPQGNSFMLKSTTGNMTTYSATITGAQTEALAFGLNNATYNIALTGSIVPSSIISINVYDAALGTNPTVVTRNVPSGGETINSAATALASSLQSALASLGAVATVTPSSISTVGVITLQLVSPNVTSFSVSVPSATVLSIAPSVNGTTLGLITGTTTVGDKVKLTVEDKGLLAVGGKKTVSYTVASGNTTADIATGLVAAVNADSDLAKLGVAAVASTGGKFSVSSSSPTATTFRGFATNSAGTLPANTEGILLGLPTNGTIPIVIGGTTSANDTVNITVYDTAISGGSQTFSTTVGSQTINQIATALASAITTALSASGISASVPNTTTGVVNVTSTSPNLTTYTGSIGGTGAHSETIAMSPTVGLSQFGYGTNGMNELQSIASGGSAFIKGTTDRPVKPVTLNSSPSISAKMIDSKRFIGQPSMAAGANTETVNATNGANSTTSTSYQFNVQGPGSKSLNYDANGNMTSDGTNAYAWDAENRLIQVTYPGTGNNTQFTIDCLGRTSKIEERTAGSVTSTKLHLWGGASRIEERDGTGSLSNGKQFFAFGQRNFSSGVGASYFYAKDNPPGSIRELTDSSGAISAQYDYSPYGQVAKIQGSLDADFQYAGYYAHPRSGMFITATRAYSPNVGRFISRDVIEEEGGLNLYAYVENNPIRYVDPQGTDGTDPDFPDTIKNSPGCLKWCKDTSNLIDCPTERNKWFLQCVRTCNQKIPPPKQQVKGPIKQNPWAAPSPGNARVPAPPDLPWWTFLLGAARAAAAAAAAF